VLDWIKKLIKVIIIPVLFVIVYYIFVLSAPGYTSQVTADIIFNSVIYLPVGYLAKRKYDLDSGSAILAGAIVGGIYGSAYQLVANSYPYNILPNMIFYAILGGFLAFIGSYIPTKRYLAVVVLTFAFAIALILSTSLVR
jgi:predicted neutral ceramidase superfamily lipid hydrolase